MGASQVALVVKNLPANTGDVRDASMIPRSERSPGGGHGNPLQCSCLENPMDREPGGLQPMGLQRIGHNWSNLACMHHVKRLEPCLQKGEGLGKHTQPREASSKLAPLTRLHPLRQSNSQGRGVEEWTQPSDGRSCQVASTGCEYGKGRRIRATVAVKRP